MVLLFGLFACSEGPFDPPYDATIGSTTEGLTIVYTSTFADEDGVGAIYHNQAVVKHDDEYGRNIPLENIAVDVYSYWPGTYILPAEAISKVETFQEACAAGEGDEKFQEMCAVLLSDPDALYLELTGYYPLAVDSDTGADNNSYRPNYLRGATDNRGILDFYLFIDSTPGGGTDFGVEMSISSDQAVMIVSTATAEGK